MAFAVLCIGLALVAASETLHSLLLQVVAAVQPIVAAHPVWGTTIVILFAALSAMLAFVSTAVIVPVAVYAWGKPFTMLLLWAGWTLGGLCAYAIGRGLGRPVVTTLTSNTALARFEYRFSARAPFGMVLLFQLALPSEVPGYVLGLLRYKFGKYVAALAIAELPFALATVYLGESFLERRTYSLLAFGAAGALLSGWAFHTLQKRLAA